MKEFSMSLLENYQRPVLHFNDVDALIDTGAIIPMFSLPVKSIQSIFNGKLILDNAEIGGIGGDVKGQVFSIPHFNIGKLSFNNFEIFVPQKPNIKYPILLSATLFYDTEYIIDTINNKFTVKIPDNQSWERDFKIKSLAGKLYPQIDGVLLQDIDTVITYNEILTIKQNNKKSYAEMTLQELVQNNNDVLLAKISDGQALWQDEAKETKENFSIKMPLLITSPNSVANDLRFNYSERINKTYIIWYNA